MRMTPIEKRFVNEIKHSRKVAERAVLRLRHVPVQRNWSYLDVGCGNGAAALLVAETFGVHVVGIDVDPQQIALARTAAGDRTDVFFMTADATCLPFEDGRFDIVATNNTTHHVPGWSSVLAEMRRVLKPQGYFVYADLKTPSWLAWVLKPLARHAGVFTGADLDRCFASLQPVLRRHGWLNYEAIFQKAVNPPGDTVGDARPGPSSGVRLAALAVLIAGTVAAGLLLNAWMDPAAELLGWVNRAGSLGPVLFVVLFLVLNTVGAPLPVLGVAAGVAFGPVCGATTLLVATAITACTQFLLARHVAGERVRQRFGHAMLRVSRQLERRGVIAVAAARLLGGPFSEFNMLAGITALKLRDFTIGTIMGCAPKALVWSGLGALLF